MKVCTLTFQDADNYGAMLQCYALQTVINDFGVDCDVVNYKCKYLSSPFSTAALKRKGIIRFLLGNINYLVRLPRKKSFSRFRSLLPLTPIYTRDNLFELNKIYDCFIVGSDCVWNEDITDFDSTFFLDFVNDNNKKNSYAASFGFSVLPKSSEEKYYNYLKSFNEITVRESSGKKILENIGLSSEVVLDPTLLVDRSVWDRIASERIVKEKYIFVYQLAPSHYLLEIVKELKKTTGLKCVFIPFPLGGVVNSRIFLNLGPLEWISLIKNAEYVVTDSFHGTAFSILYEKKVYCCINELSTRITSLLDTLGLSVFLFKNRHFELLDNISFDNAKEALNLVRSHSFEILKRIMSEKIKRD